MSRRRFPIVAVALPLLFHTAAASAWNGTGHETVALIAWDQLTPPQRQAVSEVLRAHPRFQKDLMQFEQPGENADEHAFREAATWPDLVKTPTNPLERTEDHHNWHYVDYPYDRDGKDGPRPPEQWDGHSTPTDLLQAMQMVVSQLRDPATPLPRQAIDLCWVLHLAGDVHQPLHSVSLYSNAYPTGDQGGNLVIVGTDSNPETNLHSVWDGLEGRSYEAGTIRKVADRIEKEHPESSLTAAVAITDPKAWALESFDLAKHDAYADGKVNGVTRDRARANPDGVPVLPAGYERQAHADADRQIALAGYRLAKLLQSLPMLQHSPAPSTTNASGTDEHR